MCDSPVILRSDTASISTGRIHRVVPCGKCISCVLRRRKGWTLRLLEETKVSTSAAFITLTYDDNFLHWENGIPSLSKEHVQLWIKRLRKRVDTYFPSDKSIKYYAVGEYGGQTLRPHYHAIMYNLPIHMARPNHDFNLNTELGEIWQKGHVHVDQVTEASCAYVAGYVNKKLGDPAIIYDDETGEVIERMPEFSLMSKGLGSNFMTPQMKKFLKSNMQSFVRKNGYMYTLPRYYREKIFTKAERHYMAKLTELELVNKVDILDEETCRLISERIQERVRKFKAQLRNQRNTI